MSPFLEQYAAPRGRVDITASPEALERAEVERIARLVAMVTVARSIPRRLGENATREELVLDKRRAKIVVRRLRELLAKEWKEDPELPVRDSQVRKAGAVLHWERWQAAHRREVESRRRHIATYAIKAGKRSWGNKMVARLNHELRYVEQALQWQPNQGVTRSASRRDVVVDKSR